MSASIVDQLRAGGVVLRDPPGIHVAEDVDLRRIEAGAVLEPGCRLEGERTLVRAGARLGAAGPVLLRNAAVGRDVRLESGSFEESVFLEGSSYGPSGYARAGTLFEEGASAAHATGTKQTVLLPFATLGSNVNFCDALLAGGSSRQDHSEVGSGFIHFNFTPHGPRGDKATASLFGDVVHGVWLRQSRIFLGGAGGVVGPVTLEFGTVLAAGGVYRRDRAGGQLVLGEPLPGGERPFDPRILRRVAARVRASLNYMSQLVALRCFYEQVRLPLAGGDAAGRELVLAARDQITGALAERARQIERLAAGLEESLGVLHAAGGQGQEIRQQEALRDTLPECDLLATDTAADSGREDLSTLQAGLPAPGMAVPEWIRGLSPEQVAAGERWLGQVAGAWLAWPGGAGRLLEAL